MLENDPMSQPSKAKTAAKQLYFCALRSLMAHSIRGVENYFTAQAVDLDVAVRVDKRGFLGQRPSLLLRIAHETPSNPDRDIRIQASIWLHKDASWHLARFSIAHEIYHLMKELEMFKQISGHEKSWRSLDLSTHEGLEKECHEFAQHLCDLHNDFNHGSKNAAQLLFPLEMLDAVKEGNLDLQTWPVEYGFNKECPFWHSTYFPGT